MHEVGYSTAVCRLKAKTAWLMSSRIIQKVTNALHRKIRFQQHIE